MDEGLYSATFSGEDGLCGFRNGETYMINIGKDRYGYEIHTVDEDNLMITYASAISIKSDWIF